MDQGGTVLMSEYTYPVTLEENEEWRGWVQRMDLEGASEGRRMSTLSKRSNCVFVAIWLDKYYNCTTVLRKFCWFMIMKWRKLPRLKDLIPRSSWYKNLPPSDVALDSSARNDVRWQTWSRCLVVIRGMVTVSILVDFFLAVFDSPTWA